MKKGKRFFGEMVLLPMTLWPVVGLSFYLSFFITGVAFFLVSCLYLAIGWKKRKVERFEASDRFALGRTLVISAFFLLGSGVIQYSIKAIQYAQ